MIFLLKRTVNSLAGKSVLALLFLLGVVGLFEFLPLVDHARASFPEQFNNSYDCHHVLGSRPWYGQVNPWLWFWLISTPVVVFSTRPGAPAWQRALRTISIVAMSYVVINLGTHLAMDIRNAPFHGEGIGYVNGIRVTSEANEFKFRCYDIADGAKYVFATLFGWLPALIYTGWWEIIWGVYHKRKTRLIDKNFRRDWISKIVIFASITIPVLVAGWFVIGPYKGF